MTYNEWNNHIASIFFKPENAGKDIAFYLTKNDLIKSSRPLFTGSNDDEVFTDFINAIKYKQDSNLTYSPVTRPLEPKPIDSATLGGNRG